jgi:hypothetical protein
MLHSSAGLITELSVQYWLLGVLYGILAIMLLYNLILFFFLKEQTYLCTYCTCSAARFYF